MLKKSPRLNTLLHKTAALIYSFVLSASFGYAQCPTVAAAPYCTPASTVGCSNGDYIDRVRFAGLDSNPLGTGCNGNPSGYIYYCAQDTAKVERGKSYTILINRTPAWNDGVRVWIDWNADNNFSGESVFSAFASTAIASGTITVPEDIPLGTTRMRVRCAYNATPGTNQYCSSIFYSETEDYPVLVFTPNAVNIRLDSITSPVTTCNLGSEDVTIYITNYGGAALSAGSDIPVAYQINGGTPVQEIFTLSSSVDPGQQTTYTFNTPAELSAPGIYRFKAWSEHSADGDNENDSVTVYTIRNEGVITSFPYFTDFEAETNCNTGCGAACFLTGDTSANWRNVASTDILTPDEMDWTVHSGATPSPATGPVADHTPGTVDSQYLYIESSGGCNNQTAILVSPCMDLSFLNNPTLSFWYYMYGADMGDLYTEVRSDDGNWQTLHTLSGPQQPDTSAPWRRVELDLLPYRDIAQLRFRGVTGGGNASDIAIDDIKIYDKPLHDVGVVHLEASPAQRELDLSGYTAQQRVTIQVTNYGVEPQDSLPVAYRIDEDMPVLDTITSTIPPGDTVSFTFSRASEIALESTIAVDAWTALSYDAKKSNDSLLNVQANIYGPIKVPITIFENADSNLNDYPVLLHINTADLIDQGRMAADGSDLQFLTCDDTELPYWIESGLNTDSARIWVKVPDLPASDSIVIYMMSGLQQADSTGGSNGEAVFDFFDGFSGNALDTATWEVKGGMDDISLDNSILTINVNDYAQSSGMLESGIVSYRQFGAGRIFESRGQESCCTYELMLGVGVNPNIHTGAVGAESISWYSQGSGGSTLFDSYGTSRAFTSTPYDASWRRYRIDWIDGTNALGYINDVLLVTRTVDANVPDGSDLVVGLGGQAFGGTYDVAFDWVRVRQYVSPEPTVRIDTLLPSERLTVTEDTICTGESVDFTVSPGFENYAFLINGAVVQDGATETFTTSALNHEDEVVVQLTDAYGCAHASNTIEMTVFALPVAAYNTEVNTLTATFSNTSEMSTSWLWEFGDNETSTDPDPDHTYAAAGTYTVCLTASNKCGNNRYCDAVTVCNLPEAAFTDTAVSLTMQFTDLSSDATDWYWTFGDGKFSEKQHPVYTYEKEGAYEVCLTAANACGDKDTRCDSINVVTTGIAELDASAINIYPNPSGGRFTIEVDDPDKLHSIEVSNVLGERVFYQTNEQRKGRYTVDLSDYADGLYFVKLRATPQASGSFVVRKLLINKN